MNERLLTIATCKGVQLLTKDNKYFIAQVVEDDHILFEADKNTSHLIFNDFVGQVMAGKKPTLNFDLKGK